MWVNGPAGSGEDHPQRRAALLESINKKHSIAGAEGSAFVAGARLRVENGVAEAVALRSAADLIELGLVAAVEAHRPPADEILTLDQAIPDEPELDSADLEDLEPAPPARDLAAQLVSLDGEEPRGDREARKREPPPTRDLSAMTVVEEQRDRAAAGAADDPRFRPPTETGIAAELQLEAPVTTAEPALGLAPSPSLPGEDERKKVEPPLELSLPGWRGRMRERPPVRIGIGVGAGLLLGFLLSQPFANRAERRVSELRAEADRDRYLNAEEARVRVAAIDEAADSQAARGAVGAGVIWLVVAGATFAGWWKLS